MIGAVAFQLWCVAALLALAVVAVVISRSRHASIVIYGVTMMVSIVATGASLTWLIGGGTKNSVVVLPLGLPWLGAHFQLDQLTSFFLVVINLGGSLASLYGLGYGGHEKAPHRVLPFFPAFLAGMNLVLLADDAFSYLLCWEFMSLASWALVMAHHREPGNAKAGYIYLVMASFGTLALLLAFGLLAGPAGDYGFAAIRGAQHTPYVATLVLILMLLGAGSKAGLVPLRA
jgi:formate hydrogenlyase subunit 3/multisubunit Na+/H+ antiporter MnhD subunit